MCVYRAVVEVRSPPPSLYALYFEAGSLTESTACRLASYAGWAVSFRTVLVSAILTTPLLPQHQSHRYMSHTTFYMQDGGKTLVLTAWVAGTFQLLRPKAYGLLLILVVSFIKKKFKFCCHSLQNLSTLWTFLAASREDSPSWSECFNSSPAFLQHLTGSAVSSTFIHLLKVTLMKKLSSVLQPSRVLILLRLTVTGCHNTWSSTGAASSNHFFSCCS